MGKSPPTLKISVSSKRNFLLERQPINSAQRPPSLPPSVLPSCSFKKLQSQECGIHLPIPRRQMWLQMLHGTLPSLKPFLQHCNQNSEAGAVGALGREVGLYRAGSTHFRRVLDCFSSVQFVLGRSPNLPRPSLFPSGVVNAPCMGKKL